MIRMTLEEYKAAIKAQGVPRDDYAFRCPMCGSVQSARDLINANAGADFDTVEQYLGWSCFGRWTHRNPPPSDKPTGYGDGCNWTLGGLFQAHRLIVVTPDGVEHPRFEPCTPEEAQQHAAKWITVAAGTTS